MQPQTKVIHIHWQGPLKLPEIKSMKDESRNYGVYQGKRTWKPAFEPTTFSMPINSVDIVQVVRVFHW